MKKVMVFGTFDVIHPGHHFFLKQAKDYGDYLIAVIARDVNVKRNKKHEPQFDENTRLENISKLGIADKVLLGSETDPFLRIKEERPHIIALGYDQKFYIDELEDNIDDEVIIVRLPSHHPEIYKSSIIKKNNLKQ